ncbi:recombinase family protein [Streptomyces sp. NPDC013457]|uniref:recombinase family protein n=1 Tax=Streptomyces sp. NPDC013457 TaxID=3364866 RepID=UPI003702E641
MALDTQPAAEMTTTPRASCSSPTPRRTRSPYPADRGPGHAWEMAPAIDPAVPEATTKPTRVGYARCSTAQQELGSQFDALAEAGCDPVLSEKISTRVKVRPEFVNAMDFARTIKKAVPHQRGTFGARDEASGPRRRRTSGHRRRPALPRRSARTRHRLPSRVYDPSGHGAALFAFFAGMAESERE